jgi:SAM-dependent methyltransferase
MVEAVLERHGDPAMIPLRRMDRLGTTQVEDYWGTHTVNSAPFRSAGASLRYLSARSAEYPLFEQLMDLRADHSQDVVLDYGCGPGNDLVGFAVWGRAQHVIGMDVSERALDLARSRLALHNLGPDRAELVQVTDGMPRIPLADGSIDYLYCEGVLHHTSHPEGLLAELHRVVRPGGHGHIMVYNRDSLWFHLYTAYRRQILDGDFAGLSVEDAFTRNTDGADCPIARAYRPDDFASACEAAGFRTSYLGGYFARLELDLAAVYRGEAMSDSRLGAEHRNFLAGLEVDDGGYPTFHRRLAGIGGVYAVSKP